MQTLKHISPSAVIKSTTTIPNIRCSPLRSKEVYFMFTDYQNSDSMYNIQLFHTARLTSHNARPIAQNIACLSLCEAMVLSQCSLHGICGKVALVQVSIRLLRFFHVSIILSVLRTMHSEPISGCSSIPRSKNKTNFHNKKLVVKLSRRAIYSNAWSR